MAREIKFDVILWDKGDPSSVSHYTFGEAVGEDFIDFKKDGAITPQDDSVIIREFTGLKDSKGKEIYEGDILGGKGGNGRVVYKRAVIFKDGTFTLGEEGYSPLTTLNEYLVIIGNNKLEILGNIYEQPGLLKEAKNG